MDINTLVGEVVVIVSPFLPYIIKSLISGGEKAVEKIGEEIGSGLVKGVKAFWAKLPEKSGKKSAFEKSISAGAPQVLNEEKAKELGLWLKDVLQENPQLAKEIQTIYTAQLEPETVVRIYSRNRWQLSMGNIQIKDLPGLQRALRQMRYIFKITPAEDIPLGVRLLEELIQKQINWMDIGYVPIEDPPNQPEFYDRTKIMEKIRYENQSSRVIELSGPSGIGKTHLFEALSREKDRKSNDDRETGLIPDATWGFWRYARVDCREKTTYEAIMTEWNNCLGDKHGLGSPLQDLASCLMGLKRNTRHVKKIHVLFFLDHADGLSDSVLARLAGNEGPIGDPIRKSLLGDKESFFLRLVLATRRQRLNQDFNQRNRLQYIYGQSIDPLDADTIKMMLQDRYSREFDDEFNQIDAIVQLLLEFTGGHPKAVYKALNELERRTFSGDLDGSLKDAFWKIAQYIVKEDILSELNLQEYYLLNVLGFYRCLTVNLIGQLINNGLLPENILPQTGVSLSEKQANLSKVFSQFLERTGLIRRNPVDSLYQVHPVLQPVLQKDLERKLSPVLPDIYADAFHTYYQFLTKRDGSGQLSMYGDSRATITLEAIYQFTRWKVHDTDIHDAVCEKAQNLIELDRVSVQQCRDNIAVNPDKLKILWQSDLSLHFLLKGLADDCPDLFNTLDGMFNDLA